MGLSDAGPCACMACMQSLNAASDSALAATDAVSILARICTAADADVIGANVTDKAIKIAKMVRRQCRAMDPFRG